MQLTGVTNAQVIELDLTDIRDSFGNTVSGAAASMGVLLGDTTGNGTVSATDIGQTKSQSGQPVTTLNFRTDVNVSGTINATDIGLVKSTSGNTLP